VAGGRPQQQVGPQQRWHRQQQLQQVGQRLPSQQHAEEPPPRQGQQQQQPQQQQARKSKGGSDKPGKAEPEKSTQTTPIIFAKEVIDMELEGVGPKGPEYKAVPRHRTGDPYQTYIRVRDAAIRSAKLGPDQVPHFVAPVGPGNAHLVGRPNGFQSPDGSRGWRLDYKPQTDEPTALTGIHVNWWRTEGGTQYRGAISILEPGPELPGARGPRDPTEAVFLKLLEGHFGVKP
jgi:hypothetical protein